MDERAKERADVLRFLSVEADGYEMEGTRAVAQQAHDRAARFDHKRAVLRYVCERIERGDHMPPVERTPEVVLRAMLRAYEAAALEAEVSFFNTPTGDFEAHHWADRRRDELHRWTQDIRGELADIIAGTHARYDWPEHIGDDYRARLQGDRPLDAPPAEV